MIPPFTQASTHQILAAFPLHSTWSLLLLGAAASVFFIIIGMALMMTMTNPGASAKLSRGNVVPLPSRSTASGTRHRGLGR